MVTLCVGCGKKESNQPLTLDLWVPEGVGDYGKWVEAFNKENPHITIVLKQEKWDEYWVKLPLGLEVGKGPDLFYQNTGYLGSTLKYSMAYESDVISKADFMTSYGELEAHFIEGKLYYIPMGYYTGSLYYNRKLFEQGGYKIEDLPKTWKELSRFGGQVAIRGSEVHLGWALNYQQGMPMFTEGDEPNINNSIMKNSIYIMDKLYKGKKGPEDFKMGHALFYYGTGRHYNDFKESLKEDVGILRDPLYDEKTQVVDVKFVEVSPGINKNVKKKEKEAAIAFVKYITKKEQLLIAYCKNNGIVPARHGLLASQELSGDPLMALQGSYMKECIYPGPLPQEYDQVFEELYENLYKGVDLDATLSQAQESGTEVIVESKFHSVESVNKYYEGLPFR